MNQYKYIILLFVFIQVLFFSGCSTTGVNVTEPEEIETETTQLQESSLLDVGILLFDKGTL